MRFCLYVLLLVSQVLVRFWLRVLGTGMRYGLANTNYRDEITGFFLQVKTQTKFTGCQSMQISNSKMQYIGSIAYPGAQTLRIFKSPGPGTLALEDTNKTVILGNFTYLWTRAVVCAAILSKQGKSLIKP